MIASLRGTVLELGPIAAIIEVGGVGYRVIASPITLGKLHAGEQTFLYTHDHVREDAHDLYGFPSHDELDLFERLINISGIGPKVGLAILSLGSADTVKRAIMNGDLGALTSVPGVGKKIAQKAILELKGQIVDEEGMGGEDGEVVAALVALGYSASQAKDAVRAVSADIVDVSARVREALKSLSR